jgi:hypothetical protein
VDEYTCLSIPSIIASLLLNKTRNEKGKQQKQACLGGGLPVIFIRRRRRRRRN